MDSRDDPADDRNLRDRSALGSLKTLVLDGEIDPYLSALKSVKGLVSPLLTTGKATCKRNAKGTTLKLDATSGMIIKL